MDCYADRNSALRGMAKKEETQDCCPATELLSFSNAEDDDENCPTGNQPADATQRRIVELENKIDQEVNKIENEKQ